MNKKDKLIDLITTLRQAGGAGLENLTLQALKGYGIERPVDHQMVDLAILLRECADAKSEVSYKEAVNGVVAFLESITINNEKNTNFQKEEEDYQNVNSYNWMLSYPATVLRNLTKVKSVKDLYLEDKINDPKKMGLTNTKYLNKYLIYAENRPSSFILHGDHGSKYNTRLSYSCSINNSVINNKDLIKYQEHHLLREVEYKEEGLFFEVLDAFHNFKSKEGFYSLFKGNPHKKIVAGDFFGWLVSTRHDILQYYPDTKSQLFLVPESFYYEDVKGFLLDRTSLDYSSMVYDYSYYITIMGITFMPSKHIKYGNIYCLLDLGEDSIIVESLEKKQEDYNKDIELTTYYYHKYYNFMLNNENLNLIKFSYEHKNKPYSPLDREVL